MQRENKLMYFLYLLKRQGFEIQTVFDQHVKDIYTSRFSKEFENDYEHIHRTLNEEKLNKPLQRLVEDSMIIDRDEILVYTKNAQSNRDFIIRSKSE